MKNISLFDVLVVYSDGIATSASSNKSKSKLPFSVKSGCANYNDVYAYFLENCAKKGIRAAFTTSFDITGPGRCSSYWIFEINNWVKVDKPCYAPMIFDKFAPINKLQKKRRETLFSNSTVQPFNEKALFSLFFDKQLTYDVLPTFGIPTISINEINNRVIKNAIEELNKLVSSHPNRLDFSKDLILKDRFGAGGNNIFLIRNKDKVKKIADILKEDKNISYVLQPFIEYKEGHSHNEYSGFVDIRVIYLGNKIVQTYIRIAKEEEFRCNEHFGATLLYINETQVPRKVLNVANKISRFITKKNMLFALDFIVSDNGNVYLVEGNTGPGLDWNISLKVNEIMSKKLIGHIVSEIGQRINVNNATSLLSSFEGTKVVN